MVERESSIVAFVFWVMTILYNTHTCLLGVENGILLEFCLNSISGCYYS